MIRLLLTSKRRHQGSGLFDTIRATQRLTKKFWNPVKTGLSSLINASLPLVATQSLLSQWLDLIKWARNYGKDLPDLEPELNLFIEQSEEGPTSQRNKAILAKLLDMNRRYLQLNTTKAKDAFNRVMAVTTLNSIRNPTKATDYIAAAELDLAILFREYLGSKSDSEVAAEQQEWWPSRALKYAYGSIVDNSTAANVAHRYDVREPYSITERYNKEEQLPSTTLYKIPFPDAKTSGQYVPEYIKKEYLQAPLELWPSYARKRLPTTKTSATRP